VLKLKNKTFIKMDIIFLKIERYSSIMEKIMQKVKRGEISECVY